MTQKRIPWAIVSVATIAWFGIACGATDEVSPEIVSCADNALAILANDSTYQVCETTDQQPGPNAIGSPDLSFAGDDEVEDFDLPFTFSFYGVDYDAITVDTNGHLWLGDGHSSEYDLDLPTGDGSAGDNVGVPVIAAWNTDLSSDAFGRGVRVEFQDEPNRVVVDYQTETYDDEDEDLVSRFQIVLYESGEVVFHYYYFDNAATCDDLGSGISESDDDDFVDLSDALGADVCDVADQRSFMFEPIPVVL